MNDNRYYVYIHQKITDGECFYVGKGTRDRYKNTTGRNNHWHNIVNKHGFKAIIIINNISEEKAFELEHIISTHIGYDNLCNIRTENGWGGYTMSDSTKKILSKKLQGKSKSKETKEKISLSNKGKNRTEKTKKQISQSKKGHPCYSFPERGKKISKATLGTKRSSETIERMKKPKPEGFGEKLKNRQVTWSDKISQNRIDKGCKSVFQYDKQGNYISEFPSAKAAAQYIGVHPVNMIYHLNGKYKTCKNFIFSYNKL